MTDVVTVLEPSTVTITAPNGSTVTVSAPLEVGASVITAAEQGPPGGAGQVMVNGAAFPVEGKANFISGGNVTVTAVDNPGSGRTDVTIAAASSDDDTAYATNAALTTAQALDEKTANKGVANGYAPLDGSAKVPAANLPSDVGDLLAANNLSDVASAPTSRTNLGLGTAATHPATDFDATGAAASAQSAAATDATTKANAAAAAAEAASDPLGTSAAEAVLARAAEATLTTNVAEVEVDLGENVTATALVQTNLTAEAVTARAAEGANATAITSEATTARAAEATLTTNVGTNTTNITEIETDLGELPALATTAPTGSAQSDVAAVGTGSTSAKADHLHGREAFATPSVALGTTAAAGSATTPIRSDSTIVAFDATAPTTSAVADAAAVGVATVASRRDHTHGREAFATPGSSAQGDAAAAGSATTLARSDHKHGREAATVTATTQTASYTLVLADADTVVEMNVASGNTLTVPPNSSVAFPVGTVIEVHQYGAGQTTITAGAGVTLRNPSSLTTRVQYSTVGIRKRATDEWVVSGDLT